MATEPLCLLSVHAHPDDESSKGAGTVAKYHADGVHTVLVCCTGGEEGDILNPAMDREEVKADIGAVRRAELDARRGHHRLRRGRHARLPRLGDARQRGQRQPRVLRPGSAWTKPSSGSPRSSVAPGPRSC